jgi:cytochrome c biogenesis protein
VLQRPVTDPDEIERAYSPQALRILDAVGLTDVFHAWWFVALMLLVSLSIVAASIDRFPNSWRFFSRPYKCPDEIFRKALHPQRSLMIADEEHGLVAAERSLHALGFKPERVVRENHFSIFAERNRISEMAVYIVHASLLLIFFGGIVDGLLGWRGSLVLNEGETSSAIGLRDGSTKRLPFAIRCEEAGQQNYTDGTPKKWWSKLVVVQDGHDVGKKEILVNDPLVHGGIRFYQSNFGANGKVDELELVAIPTSGAGRAKPIKLTLDAVTSIDSDVTVRIADVIPDYVIRDRQIYKRSNQMVNPAVGLELTPNRAKSIRLWLPLTSDPDPALADVSQDSTSPYRFEIVGGKLGHFTGLQVSYEPGQWAVWAGVVLLGVGLAFVFYVVHARIWAVPVRDGKTGKLTMWLGGNANRNRDAFEQRFNDLVAKIETELKSTDKTSPPRQAEVVTGR